MNNLQRSLDSWLTEVPELTECAKCGAETEATWGEGICTDCESEYGDVEEPRNYRDLTE